MTGVKSLKYKYENVCSECGKPFETNDEEATICFDCWEKIATMIQLDVPEIEQDENQEG